MSTIPGISQKQQQNDENCSVTNSHWESNRKQHAQHGGGEARAEFACVSVRKCDRASSRARQVFVACGSAPGISASSLTISKILFSEAPEKMVWSGAGAAQIARGMIDVERKYRVAGLDWRHASGKLEHRESVLRGKRPELHTGTVFCRVSYSCAALPLQLAERPLCKTYRRHESGRESADRIGR